MGNKHRVFVTGIGVHCSLGADLETYWSRLIAGENGIAAMARFDARDYSVGVAATAAGRPGTGVGWYPDAHTRIAVRYFVSAAGQAYADAGLSQRPIAPARIGAGAGSSVNYFDHRLMAQYFRARTPGKPEIDLSRIAPEAPDFAPMFRRQGEIMISVAARKLGLGGPSFMIDTACSASAHTIGESFRLIQQGKADAMIAGGSAALAVPCAILAFDLIGALSRNRDPETASRPFDKLRDGFVMGEGAGAVVLESERSMLSRGARPYAELAGYGQSLNAYNLTDPTPDGSGESRAIQQAIDEAGVAPQQVDYVAAHGTSTPKNDAVETLAIKRVFGDHAYRLLVSSNKGQIGHTISAAGVMNAVSVCMAMRSGVVPPTAHLQNPDPACDLNYVPGKGVPHPVRFAVANAFAFGGQNAVLAFRSPSPA